MRNITIRELRKQSGLSRKQVYSITSISPQRLSYLERVDINDNSLINSITYREAIILSSLYGYKIDVLFFDSMFKIKDMQVHYFKEGQKYAKN